MRIEEQPLERIRIDGRDHPHAFAGRSSERRTTTVSQSRVGVCVESGLDELFLLKSTGSAFCGFLTDRFTTLKDAPDRILATMLKAQWLYSCQRRRVERGSRANPPGLWSRLSPIKEPSVQQTLYAMGEAVLDSFPEIEKITLTMPNKHRILADLEAIWPRKHKRDLRRDRRALRHDHRQHFPASPHRQLDRTRRRRNSGPAPGQNLDTTGDIRRLCKIRPAGG